MTIRQDRLKSDDNYIYDWNNHTLLVDSPTPKKQVIGTFGAPLRSVLLISETAHLHAKQTPILAVANAAVSSNGNDDSRFTVSARHPFATDYSGRRLYTFYGQFIDGRMRAVYEDTYHFTGWSNENFTFFPSDYAQNPFTGLEQVFPESGEADDADNYLLNYTFDMEPPSVGGKGLPSQVRSSRYSFDIYYEGQYDLEGILSK